MEQVADGAVKRAMRAAIGVAQVAGDGLPDAPGDFVGQ